MFSGANEQKDQMESPWLFYLQRGLEIIYGEYVPPEPVEAFITHWGKPALRTFLQALSKGKGQERLIALCVLGESDIPQKQALLLPFLQGTNARERWISALFLGQMKEEAAFFMLIQMLTEFLSLESLSAESEYDLWFEDHRADIPYILDQWDTPDLVIVLRQALLTAIAAEQSLPKLPKMHGRRTFLYNYQDALATVLGRRGAFGVLAGVSYPLYALRLAIVNMAAGYCHARDMSDSALLGYPWDELPQLRKAMMLVLGHQFGLSEKEQNEYLEQYAADRTARDQNARFHLTI